MIKKLLAITALAGVWALPTHAQSPMSGSVIDAGSDDRTLVHVEEFDVPVSELWALYTQGEEVERWMAPVAQVDLRSGGSIRTNYNACATIGDEGTITLDILAYVPERLLLLHSDLEPQREAAWMNETIFANRERLYNLIEFEELEAERSRIVSWGLGYGQSEEWATMVAFFERGNAFSYGQLRKALAGETVWPLCKSKAQ